MAAVVRDKVRFVETDAMGVVHHSNYFRWFEMGRVEFLRQAGITLNELIAEGIVFPITDVACKYRASARFDDGILIETQAEKLTAVKMVFSYRIVREADGLLLATGRTQNVFTDSRGKVIRLPAVYCNKLKAVEQV
ncbi:acyl-CoA thioesterase|uniref:Acyl-CoA thioester hydrolase n=1 Tax=Dendrosporobacter quercicolus TaxID=146817 RepID=A0A1H0ADQ2_9FIRM|nr:thioesterase family protein [Dendrosporobacter quercicolus]NSL50051.1 acyl-CoA thioesterase [Dendrosporobacter quercicolus DSM 1736]SDN31451.1 acyl-CoA thioester hydrolase [Dendrosporobacter quercicolus]